MTVLPERPRSHARGEALTLVLRELRDAIADGRLEPGARIYQEEVAALYGTSRLPVREALRRLETEGFVVVLPNAGARVARLDAAELDEVYWLRERLEPEAIARSAERLTADELAELRRNVEEISRIGGSDPARWLTVDAGFHRLAISAAGLPRVQGIVDGLWNVAGRYRSAYAASLDDAARELADAEHRLLLDALELRRGEDAAAILRVHIRRTRLGLAERADLFSA